MVLTTFLADLRSYTLPVGPPKGHEKPPVDSIASNSHIDLRIQLLALTASEPTTKKKSPLRSSVKTFLTACSRAFCPRIESAPHEENLNTHGALHMFGALGPYCCEAVLNNLPLSQLKLQEQVQITLNKVFDEIHVENEPSLQSEIISSLYNLVKSMISSPFVDNASFFALMERCLNSFTSDIKVPQILTDLITHDTSSRVLNGYISQNADLIYDLLSVGLTEMLEEDGRLVNGPAASTATQSNHLDAIDIAMRRHVKKAIEQSHASTPTARQAPAREQNWETIKELLWPIADRLSMSGPQLFEAVFQLLTSDRSDEHIQEELIDFLGLDQFETVSNLITDRAAWNVWHKRYRIDPQGVQNDGDSKRTKKSKSKKQRRGADATDHPHVNDATATDVVEMLLNNPETLAREREEQLMAAAASSSSRFTATKTSYADTEQPKLPFVFDALAEARGRGGFSGARKMALPEGTATGHKDDWDFFEFPIPKKDTLDFLNVPVIEISQLDRIGRIAFEGVERLNPIQSIVFDAAYNSSENLLICAPTGAGKTNTAMLTVVRLIREHLNEDFVLDLKSFKVVYMAPMKALAAEMTATFSKRLNPLGIKVRECTGDMQLSKQEIMDTQMLVTTPEKWDVISRKGAGDASLVQALKLLIIDEVHLLHEDRGAVIEALVARTLRQVEVSQSMIRIVGLSATLPNYVDVAQFLRVNLNRGLFYFDSRFRPVPLGMSFLGVTPPNRHSQEEAMNEACYQKVIEQLRRNEQVMVFVHARGETSKTARWIRDAATQRGDMAHFQPLAANTVDLFKRVPHCHDATVRELAVQGIACHHAGMLRPDRRLVEQLFSNRVIRVLVCTATLAWGVNLPAHAVIIKGTKIYDADKSDFVDLDILDVVQIFGRAGRPQFDTFGLATIITTRDKLDHYVRLITNQVAIESKLLSNINDHLNAEIALGTVTNIDEAVTWLSYTYLFVRLQRSPLNYGITPAALQDDPDFTHFMTSALRAAALELDRAEMVRYEESTGQLASTDRGRTASLYYIKYETAALVKDALHPLMLIADLFALISQAHEFSSMKVRDEEEGDLLDLEDNVCHVPVKNPGTVDSSVRKKINVLLQAYISRQQPRTHSLISDMNYIQQNAGRLARYIFEIAVRRGWAVVASNAHRLSKMIERQMWYDESPLWQLTISGKSRLLERVDIMGLTVDRIRELGPNELKDILRYEGKNGAQTVFEMAQSMPVLRMLVDTQPITRNIIRCHIKLEPDFTWVLSQHGQQLLYWIWIEDPEEAMIYHSEVFTLQRKAALSGEPAELVFTIPVHEPIPPQYLVRCMPDRWLGAESVVPVILRNILLPQTDPPHTDLLNLTPLPVTALKNPQYEGIFNFTHFNPIQTQIFHSLYHQDVNILLGSPTGSGKTVAAELAILRVFNTAPHKKCIYIAPLKALVRERVDDWSVKIGQKLGKRVVELTGDVTPDIGILRRADVIVTTPEKWDGISRMWRQRAYVRDIALIIIDEIHMVGEERGPVLEVIVSRANFIANQLNQAVRIVGLSTALANAVDMAAWLRVPLSPESAPDQGQSGLCGRGLFNFRPSVRPVPLEVHIQGYPGRHYCPRMATMNRPIFQAIQTHSASKPVLVFVASRRQTRRTAFDLISYSQSASNPQQWLHMNVQEMENLAATIVDSNLQLTLPYGIGLHHAGLRDRDRRIVEELFVNQKIQVLIATSTLAWGVNFPAHLVIIKGTEYFDGKTKRYVDFPITDVLQMMGRAGRPQFDNEGKAVVMVQDTKKAFYKRFLYEPFPVESCLLQVLADYLNAEIATGSVSSMQSALECITWTFFFRRLMMNPNYYHLEETTADAVNRYLSEVVSGAVNSLIENGCVEQDPEDPLVLLPTSSGRLASFYYLSHKTIGLFTTTLTATTTIAELLYILSLAEEFALLPVRHAEDETNAILAREMPLPVKGAPESPHTKAHILLQAYLSRRTLELPISDYVTDTKSVLDQAPRVLQAAIDFCAENGWLTSTLHAILLTQMISQALWLEDSSLLQLPNINSSHLAAFIHPSTGEYIESLPELLEAVKPPPYSLIKDLLFDHLAPDLIRPIHQTLSQFPVITVSLDLVGPDPTADSPEAGDCCRHLPILGLDIASEQTSAFSESALPVFCDTDYALSVNIHSIVPAALAARSRAVANKSSQGATPSVKSREPGWILVLGAVGRNNTGADSCLLALRKVSGSQLRHCDSSPRAITVSFRLDSELFAPAPAGGRITDALRLHLFVMSDTYLALDQQLPFGLCVQSSPLRYSPRSIHDEMEM